MDAPSMSDRVRERLDALSIGPITAAKKAGLERGFLNDLLTGRKKSVRGESLQRLADALECDPAYLTGHQPTPSGGTVSLSATRLPIVGVAETGTWREVASDGPHREAPVLPDPRFLDIPHAAYEVRGNHGKDAGIDDGDIVIGLDPAAFTATRGGMRDGLVCVVRRYRDGGALCETTIRRASASPSGFTFVALDGSDAISEGAEVASIVDRAVRFFL